MLNTRVLLSAAVTAGAIAALSSSALADTTTSCSTLVDELLATPNDPYLQVQGTVVSSRGSTGYTGFTMNDGFQIENTPLHTTPSTYQRHFSAGLANDNAFAGNFHTVFIDRGNGKEDRSRLWVGRGGAFYIYSYTWGGGWKRIQGTTCFRGDQDKLMLTGHIDGEPGYGTSYWTFTMQAFETVVII